MNDKDNFDKKYHNKWKLTNNKYKVSETMNDKEHVEEKIKINQYNHNTRWRAREKGYSCEKGKFIRYLCPSSTCRVSPKKRCQKSWDSPYAEIQYENNISLTFANMNIAHQKICDSDYGGMRSPWWILLITRAKEFGGMDCWRWRSKCIAMKW